MSDPLSPPANPEPAHPPEWHMRVQSHSEEQTLTLGKRLAESLRGGQVVALVGNLGAGKTRLVQAVATTLGVDRRQVTSPTFVLVQEYEGDELDIAHFDTYRLASAQEFVDLGAEEYLHGRGVCFIEWADRVAEILPSDHLRIEIQPSGETSREFSLRATGPRSAEVLERMRAR